MPCIHSYNHQVYRERERERVRVILSTNKNIWSSFSREALQKCWPTDNRPARTFDQMTQSQNFSYFSDKVYTLFSVNSMLELVSTQKYSCLLESWKNSSKSFFSARKIRVCPFVKLMWNEYHR